MECRELKLYWSRRMERDGDQRYSIWHGTNQAGEKVRVYVSKIEALGEPVNDHEKAFLENG